MQQLPETGFLRLSDILGKEAITPQQAEANRAYNERRAADALAQGKVDSNGYPAFHRKPTTPTRTKPGLIPVKASTWWAGVKSGRYPQPVKISPRVTAWRVSDIRALIEAI